MQAIGFLPPSSTLTSQESEFTFNVTYPDIDLPKRPSRTYDAQMVWRRDYNCLILVGGIHGACVRPWNSMETFLKTVGNRVSIFLDDDKYQGTFLTLPDAQEGEITLHPAYKIYLGLKNVEKEDIMEAIPRALQTFAHALYFAHPLFRFVADEKREPNSSEMMRLLSVEYGLYELTRIPPDVEEEEEKAELRRVFLPIGLGGRELMAQ